MPHSADLAQVAPFISRLEQCRTIEAMSKIYLKLPEREENSLAHVFLWRFGRISTALNAALLHSNIQQKRAHLRPIEERLTVLVYELELRQDTYHDSFYHITKNWLHLVNIYMDKLDKIVELGLEIDNPYIFGMPLASNQEIFVGRTDISRHLRRVLIDNIHLPAMLYGQRRMGKTSLLKNLGRLLPKGVIFLFVDGQGIGVAQNYLGLLYNMSREMSKSAKQQGVIFPPLTRQELEIDPFSIFNEWLDNVEEFIINAGYEKAVLALDEFEALDHGLDLERFDAEDMFYMLRYLIQNRDRFEILLAGSHEVSDMNRWATHLVNIKTVKISYLLPEEALELIEHPTRDFPLAYTPQARQRILDLTRGHPHLIQLLCYEVVKIKNNHPTPERYTATLTDVEAVIPRALSKGSFFFIDIQENQITPHGRKILNFMAHQGEEGHVSAAAFAAQFPTDDDEEARKLLLHRDLVELTELGYKFQVELIRRWFANN